MKIPTRVTPRVEESKQALASLSSQGADANAFGAQIGQGISNLGQGIQAYANSEIEKQKKVEDFDLARRFTEKETELAETINETKRAAPPGGTGVRANADLIHKKAYDEFMATVPERAKGEYTLKVEQSRQRTILDAVGFQNKAADAHFVQGIADETSRAKNAVNESPDDLMKWNKHVVDIIDKTDLPDIQKEQEKRKALGDLAVVRYKAMVRTGEYSKANLPVEGGVSVFVDRVFKAESGNDPTAQNPKSSAGGLGQFLDRTWVEQLRLARPDLTQGQPDAYLLGLKLDSKLQREVTAQYATQNANALRSSGFAPTPGNIYLAHFLGPEGAKRILGAPDAQPIQTLVGTEAYKANKEVFDNATTAGALKQWAISKMGGGGAELPRIAVTKGTNGYWNADGVTYELEGKARPIPPTKEYLEKVVPAIRSIDPTLGIKITSGGQRPGEGVGSHRHDTNASGEAHTTDFVLTKNGKVVTPEQEPKLYERAVEELAAQGFTGIGHYSWGLHVGGGTRAVWGPDKTSATANPSMVAAVQRGWARAGDSKRDALDTDPAYASIPYEDRVALRADGQREARSQLTQETQQRQAETNQKLDQLYTALFDGKAGQMDIDKARASGLLSSYEDIVKATTILDRKEEGLSLEQSATQKLATGLPWDPSNADDKKMLNALIGEKGKEAIATQNRDFISSGLIPLVNTTKDIPTEAAGTLQAMLRSSNMKQVGFALDVLTQLRAVQPQAFNDRVSSDTQRDIERFSVLRNVMPEDELLRTMKGGFTQEEQQATMMRRKEGEALLAKKDGNTPRLDNVIKEVVNDFDGWFTRAPKVGQTASAVNNMERFVETIWLEEYAKTGNVDASTAVAKKAAAARFGVTELGNKGKQLMELPPEKAGYRPLGGDFTWIDKNIRTELKLTPDQKYELVSDEQTRREFKDFQAGGRLPSYHVILTDDKGVPRAAVFDERGRPRRMFFAPDAEDKQRNIDYFSDEATLAKNKLFFKDSEKAMKQAFDTGIPVPVDLKEEYDRIKLENAQIVERRRMREKQANPDKYENTIDLRDPSRDLFMTPERIK